MKSLRSGKANIAESYAAVEGGELWLINGYIPAYAQAKTFGHDERRRRKLLVSKRELAKLWQGTAREGMTLVPLRLYFNDRGKAKLHHRHRQGQEAGRQARHRGQARLGAPEGAADARAGLRRRDSAPPYAQAAIQAFASTSSAVRKMRISAGTSGAKMRVAPRIQGMSVTRATLLKRVRFADAEPGVAPDRAGGVRLELGPDLVEHLDPVVPAPASPRWRERWSRRSRRRRSPRAPTCRGCRRAGRRSSPRAAALVAHRHPGKRLVQRVGGKVAQVARRRSGRATFGAMSRMRASETSATFSIRRWWSRMKRMCSSIAAKFAQVGKLVAWMTRLGIGPPAATLASKRWVSASRSALRRLPDGSSTKQPCASSSVILSIAASVLSRRRPAAPAPGARRAPPAPRPSVGREGLAPPISDSAAVR